MSTTREWTLHLLIRSLTDRRRKKISKEIIGEVRPEWFSIPRYKKALQLIKDEYANTNSFLTWASLLKHPSLNEKSAKYIRTKEIRRMSLRKEDPSLALPSTAKEYRDFFSRAQSDARHAKLVELSNKLSQDLSEEMEPDRVNRLIDLVQDTTSWCNTLKESHGKLFEVSKELVQDTLKSFYKELTRGRFFMPTGFKAFDTINLGIPLDSLFLIMGVTGSGKSALALTLCVNGKKLAGARVCFVPLEMSVEQMLLRLGSHLLRVPVTDIVKSLKKYYNPMVKAISEFIADAGPDGQACFDFYVPDMDDSLPDILHSLETRSYDMICIDYAKLIPPPPGLKEHEALDRGAAFAKRWSSTHRCIVMHINQLDEQTDNIRYSKAVKEHGSNCFSLDGNPDSIRDNGYVTIRQPKARNQSNHPFRLKADLACSWFGDWLEEIYEEPKKRAMRKGLNRDHKADVPNDIS
jgi:archaellum biogenesis ATPase FlaH